jgi:flagellar hook assembly protein FlgD
VDVTFDGVHILNKDIVSSKPYIRILVKDENKYLKLDDTSLISLKIRFPSDYINPRTIPFDGTICKFIPAANEKNEAVIEYRPNFTEDGEYQLIVNARDKSGNVAGKADYEVSFEVINKSSITNVLNYPNPFSTATAFVFTLTGSEIPTHFKIQIMTVTGKVVREITQQELGPIRIGRNMTEYKWDGRDQYGQLLGNGVYLYRVVSSIHGKEIEHRQSGADKFYKNGYGKLYIMR